MAPEFILGLSSIHGRFAVSVFEDGVVRFAVEEDKLRRFRGLGLQDLRGLGSRALDAALARVPGGVRGLGRIAYVPPIRATSEEIERDTRLIESIFDEYYGAVAPIVPVDHVEAHLAFERAVHPGTTQVFMLGRTRAVYSEGPGRDRALDVECGLVAGIERLAAFAGFPPSRIHHLENMARFGEPALAGEFGELLRVVAGMSDEDLERRLGGLTGLGRRLQGGALEQKHYDYAASLYAALEAGAAALLGSVPDARREGSVAMCGGAFQSWTLNDSMARAFPGSAVCSSFAPGNASGAIGGPLALGGVAVSEPVGPFLGPEYTREEIKSVLDNSRVRYALGSSGDTLDRVCSALGEGQMVGWFRGRCEFGYRALGGRSVFASPSNPYACDNLSSYLKKRPSWFAYAVAIDETDEAVRGVNSPWLSRSSFLAEYFGEARVRVQTVSRSSAPPLWGLLSEFRSKTGVRALLNTSLNYFDEPIACMPRDALKTFYASGIDMLVIEDFRLIK
jgi:predicted NodU family carbamoyl transferase